MVSDIRRRIGFAAAVAILVAACTGTAATPAPATPAPAPATAAPASAAPAESGTAGCTTPAATTINIGFEGPFTGPNALTGEEMKNASSMAFDAINWQVGPYKINPVYIDDQSDPAKGAAAYEQAVVGQKIIAGLLGWHSSVAVAQMEVAAKYKIPHFFAMGATGIVNEKFNERPGQVRLLGGQGLAGSGQADHRLRPGHRGRDRRRQLSSRPRRRSRSTARTPTGAAPSARASRTSWRRRAGPIVCEDFFPTHPDRLLGRSSRSTRTTTSR